MGCINSSISHAASPRCLVTSRTVDFVEAGLNAEVIPVARWPQRRICVIGAGPAGLLVARYLCKMGYTVNVYESKRTVGGYASTAEVDGYTFDMATKYIPSTTAVGPGAVPHFQRLLHDYRTNHGLEFQSTPGPATFDSSADAIVDLPVQLQRFPPKQIVMEAIKGFDFVAKMACAHDIHTTLTESIFSPGESIEEWARRENLEAFSIMCAYIQDAFGAGPTLLSSAAWAMSYRKHYITTGIAKLLRGALKKSSGVKSLLLQLTVALKAHPILKHIVEQEYLPEYIILTKGYQHFWQLLVNVEGFEVNTSEPVVKLTKTIADAGAASWSVKTTKSESTFDSVIVATDAAAYKAFMPSDHCILPLMEQCQQGTGTEVWLFRVKDWSLDRFGTARGMWLLQDVSCALATEQMPRDGRIYGISKEYEDSNVIIGIAYKNPEVTPLPEGRIQKERLMRDAIYASCKLVVTEVLDARDFAQWPCRVPVAAEKAHWHHRVAELQGQDNIFFVGEPCWSAGVMNPADCAPHFCKTHF